MKNKNKSKTEVIEDAIIIGQDDILDSVSKDLAIIESQRLPTNKTSSDLTSTQLDPLKQYIKEISRYKLLSSQEEEKLIKELLETGDIEVAKKLVVANLRLVVKIAMEYKNSYKNVLDLIQEGNIGLMKAVSKYNPDKGAKLSYYASWWIKSYILKYILDNFRLVKIGTTADQKKLFYNLMREKERLESMGIKPDAKTISENLGVTERSVIEMDQRLSSLGSEMSLDRPVDSDQPGGAFMSDFLADGYDLEQTVEDTQSVEILQENLVQFIDELGERDQEIFKKRLLSEVPASLQQIGDEYGISRERVRQIESRLLSKLKIYMSQYIR